VSATEAAFAYDDVLYDSEANPSAHPSSIATLACLAGLPGASPASARVLEIGCGNGANLLAAATYLPDARFTGLDLSSRAIAAGDERSRPVKRASGRYVAAATSGRSIT